MSALCPQHPPAAFKWLKRYVKNEKLLTHGLMIYGNAVQADQG